MVRSMDAADDSSSSGRRTQDSEGDASTTRHRQYARARRREAAGSSGGVLSSLRQVILLMPHGRRGCRNEHSVRYSRPYHGLLLVYATSCCRCNRNQTALHGYIARNLLRARRLDCTHA